MTKTLTTLAFISVALITNLYGQEPSIRQLEGWIGSWKVEEVFLPGSKDENRTKSERRCEYILNNTYIRCETKEYSIKSGTREYQFFINYNNAFKRFEMISIYSNWSQQRRDIIVPDSTGKRWDLIGLPTVENNIERKIWGVIEFKNDQMIWTGKLNTSQMKPDEWKLLFIEESIRQ